MKAKELFNPLFEAMLDTSYEEVQEALDEMDRILENEQIRIFPPRMLRDYKNDRRQLIKAEENLAYKAGLGRTNSIHSKELADAYYSCRTRLAMLELRNEQFRALIDASLVRTASAFVALVVVLRQLSALQQKRGLEEEIKKTKQALLIARDDASSAEWQMIINGALTVAGALLPQLQGLKAAAAAMVGIVVPTIIDAALGPEQWNTAGTVANTVNTWVGASNKFSEGFKKFASAANGLLTLKMDIDEVDKAFVAIEKAKAKVELLHRELGRAELTLRVRTAELARLKETLFWAVSTSSRLTTIITPSTSSSRRLGTTLRLSPIR